MIGRSGGRHIGNWRQSKNVERCNALYDDVGIGGCSPECKVSRRYIRRLDRVVLGWKAVMVGLHCSVLIGGGSWPGFLKWAREKPSNNGARRENRDHVPIADVR